MFPGPVPCSYLGVRCTAVLEYGGSWVEDGLAQCFQVMEVHYTPCGNAGDVELDVDADDGRVPLALQRWMAAWEDLTAFETREVLTSKQAAARVASLAPRTGAGVGAPAVEGST